MNYTRKRALLACDFCRHRKRRCDGERPCSTCRESNADCRYKDLPIERVDSPASPLDVVERLARIEGLLEQHGQQLDDLVQGVASSAPSSNSTSLPPLYLPPEFAASPAALSVRSSQGRDSPHPDSTQFLIPYDHSTSANTLLSLPQVRYLVGEYPKTYFFELELAQPLPPQLDLLHAVPPWPSLNPAVLDSFAANYFASVHPNHPLFSRHIFQQWRAKAYETGPSETLENAMCCCVWGLGSLATKESTYLTPAEQTERDEIALRLFQPALRLILRRSIWSFRPSLDICQALLLVASYFSHMGRPLHSSKMAYLASRHFLQLLDEQRRAGPGSDHNDSFLRVFWGCFIMECDCIADLDIPRSGVEPMADRMSLPRSLDPEESDAMIYFVAETAVRRLLNRIHCSLYAADHSGVPTVSEGSSTPANISLSKMLALSSELNRQLEEWYHSIPGKLRPPIGVEAVASDRGKILRIRYYAARHIIHRPFVLSVAFQQMRISAAAASTPGSSHTPPNYPIPRMVLEKCDACIQSCTSYLYNVVAMLDRRSPYLWSISQSCMACLLVLLMADNCPQLRPFTPDIKPLQRMVINALKRWAAPGTSFEAVVKVLESFRVAERFQLAA